MQGRVGLCGGVLLPPCGSFIMSRFLRWHGSLPESNSRFATSRDGRDAAGDGGFVLDIRGGCLCSGLGRVSALEWLFR